MRTISVPESVGGERDAGHKRLYRGNRDGEDVSPQVPL